MEGRSAGIALQEGAEKRSKKESHQRCYHINRPRPSKSSRAQRGLSRNAKSKINKPIVRLLEGLEEAEGASKFRGACLKGNEQGKGQKEFRASFGNAH